MADEAENPESPDIKRWRIIQEAEALEASTYAERAAIEKEERLARIACDKERIESIKGENKRFQDWMSAIDRNTGALERIATAIEGKK